MAVAKRSFAHGNKTIAKGEESHAEGYQSVTLGDGSHAEGAQTVAAGLQSHSEGALTQALGAQSHAEGHDTIAAGLASHAEGAGTKIGSYSPSSDQGADQSSSGGGGGGGDTPPSPGTFTAGEGSHAEGYNNLIVGFGSHAEGLRNYVTGNYSHVEGVNNTNSANYAHVEGFNNINSGEIGHVEGDWNNNSGYNAHVFGHHNTNTYNHKVVFGWYNQNKANTILEVGKGDSSTRSNAFEVYQDGHAEVATVGSTNNSVITKSYLDTSIATRSTATNLTNGTGAYSLKQADNTSSSSHTFAEGYRTTASGNYAHSEGADTTASADYSHAEGANTVASGVASHAGGLNTNAKLQAQTVIGKFNADVADSLFIVGNGTADSAAGRTNAFVVYNDGRAAVSKDPTNNMDVATKKYVDDNIPTIINIDITAGTAQGDETYFTITQQQHDDALNKNKEVFVNLYGNSPYPTYAFKRTFLSVSNPASSVDFAAFVTYLPSSQVIQGGELQVLEGRVASSTMNNTTTYYFVVETPISLEKE